MAKSQNTKPLAVRDVAVYAGPDVDETRRWNVESTNAGMEECVNWGAKALQDAHPVYPEDLRFHMRAVLLSMRWTHRLIRRVLGFKDKPMQVEGLSLARIPLETLFTFCLMLEDPEWVRRYLRDGWKKQYTRFILQREETKHLPRWDEFNTKSGLESLTQLQQLLGITAAQKATIDLNELGVPLPPGMKLEGLPRFPTPQGVLQEMPRGDKRRMLERLYPEYVWLCSFVHALPDAMFYKMASDPDARVPSQFSEATQDEAFHRRVREPAYLTSLLSVLQAVTELTVLYPGDVNLRASVTKAWKDIAQAVMFGRILWDVRTKALLGVIS